MPRPKRNTPTKRLNLEMNEKVKKNIERLRDETQADSLAEVIRRALALYDTLWETTRDGSAVIIRTESIDREVLIPEFRQNISPSRVTICNHNEKVVKVGV